MVYFIETNDDSKVVRVGRDEQGTVVEVVENDLTAGDFNLVNNLKSSAIAEAREEAKRNGLKLSNAKNMAARVRV